MSIFDSGAYECVCSAYKYADFHPFYYQIFDEIKERKGREEQPKNIYAQLCMNKWYRNCFKWSPYKTCEYSQPCETNNNI